MKPSRASSTLGTMILLRWSCAGSFPSKSSSQPQNAGSDILGSGMWLVVPTYMAYVFASDILNGLSIAGGDSSSTPAKTVAAIKDE